MRKRTTTLILAAFALLASPARAQPVVADLDPVVSRAMADFQVPGVAVAVVKDGKLLVAKGYGVVEAGAPGRVQADTRFTIGTNTKQFTAAALAMLVAEGRLAWDDPVTKYLPGFRLSDPYVTRELRIRDLLGHRMGLRSGAGNLMIYPETDFTRAEMIDALAHLPVATGFRDRLAYSNLAYVAAGEIVAAVSGQPWHTFVERRVFQPLGMDRCSAAGDVPPDQSRARSHIRIGAAVRSIATPAFRASAPANGIWCDLDGLVRWAGMLANGGRLADGTIVIPSAQLGDMWSLQTRMTIPALSARYNRTHLRGYGLGWNLEDFEGRLRAFHTGGVLGQLSQISVIPDERLGIVVLVNQASTDALNAITLHIAKSLLGTGQQDWVAIYGKQAQDAHGKAEQRERELLAATDAEAIPDLSLYAGVFRNPWRGELTVETSAQGLKVRIARAQTLSGRLTHLRGHEFIVRWDDRTIGEDAVLRFHASPAGTLNRISVESLPTSEGNLDFENVTFARVPS